LYIDNNPDDRLMLREAAKSVNSSVLFFCLDGYRSAVAYLGGEGDFADRQKYPLPVFVLLDYALNGNTGADLLCWMRADRKLKGMPVVIYSDSDQPERLALCYRGGANYYLRKARSFPNLMRLMECLDECFASDPPNYALLLTQPEYRPPPKRLSW
jgi:CheY-like chemotaxis protein